MKYAIALTLWSALSFCGSPGRAATACSGTCVSVDLSSQTHVISPQLFGNNMTWSGWTGDMDLIKVNPDYTSGGLRYDVLDKLRAEGLTLLRYGGDGFDLAVSTRPLHLRLQDRNMLMGADEFAQIAVYLGADVMLEANVATGTPEQAVALLAYLRNKGVKVRFMEIGNELYGGWDDDAVFHNWDGARYAAAFDTFAHALRNADPSLPIGMIGCHPGSDLDIMCRDRDWNKNALLAANEKIDFMSVHNSYAPVSSVDDAVAGYRSLFAAPDGMRENFDALQRDIALYAKPASAGMKIAVTEHGAFWLSPPGSVPGSAVDELYKRRSLSLGSALFSALSFNVFLSRPAIPVALHMALLDRVFQGLFKVPPFNATYPVGYDPAPERQAYTHVLRLYREAAGGAFVPLSVTGSPTFDNVHDIQLQYPRRLGVPSIDAVAARLAGSTSRYYVYVVNRDVLLDIPATITLGGRTVLGLSAAQLTGADVTTQAGYESDNAVSTRALPAPASGAFAFTFPAHSLTRFTVDASTAVVSAPKGFLDVADCAQLAGWACDADDYARALQVRFYDGPRDSGGFLGEATANLTREPAVGAACGGGTSAHGYSVPTPVSVKDGRSHAIYAYAVNIGPAVADALLAAAPKTILCQRPPAILSIDARSDLGAAQSLTGFLEGFYRRSDGSISLPADGSIDILKPRYWRMDAMTASAPWSFTAMRKFGDAKVTAMLSDFLWYQGALAPIPWVDWPGYEAKVRSLVADNAASGRPVQFWDLYNEPDWIARPVVTRAQILDIMRKTYGVVRGADPQTKIVAPSLSNTFDAATMEAFLQYFQANAMRPDAVSWHELGNNPSLLGAHVAAAKSLMRQYGLCDSGTCPKIHINEYGSGQNQLIPGWEVAWLSFLNQNIGDVSWVSRSCWTLNGNGGEFDCVALDGLLTPQGQPRPVYWVHRVQADMEGGRILATQGSDDAAAALASRDADGTIRIMAGRASCGATGAWCRGPSQTGDQPLAPAPVTLTVTNAPSAAMDALIVRIPNQWDRIFDALPQITDIRKVRLFAQGGKIMVSLPDFQDGDAYSIILTPVKPPLLRSLSPASAVSGRITAVTAAGESFQPGAVVVATGPVTVEFAAQFVSTAQVNVALSSGLPIGSYSITIRNPDGQVSNALPLSVQAPPYASHFVSQSVPASMAAGGQYSVSVTMENAGSSPWIFGMTTLGSVDPPGSVIWGASKIHLAEMTVPPGGRETFSWSVTAPSAPGTYTFRWRMTDGAAGAFGALSPAVLVAVSGPPVALGVSPSVVTAGQSAAVTLWGDNLRPGAVIVSTGIVGGSVACVWVASFMLSASVAASTTAGTYSLAVRNPDGQYSKPLTLTIAPPPSGHTLDAGSLQLSHPAGTTVAGLVTVTARPGSSTSALVAPAAAVLYADDLAVSTTSGPPYLFRWDTTKVSNGAHVLTLRTAAGEPPAPLSVMIVNNDAASTPTERPVGVSIDPEALGESVAVRIAAEDAPSSAAKELDARRRGLARVGTGVLITAIRQANGQDVDRFQKPIEVSLGYSPAAAAAAAGAAALDPALLAAYVWDAAQQTWRPASSARPDSASATIVVGVDQPGTLALFAPASLSGASAIAAGQAYAYPNPAVAPAEPVIRAALGDVESVEISIFDVSGRKVHGVTAPGTSAPYFDYAWRGPKPSGVYVAVVQGRRSDGSKVKALAKLAVVR